MADEEKRMPVRFYRSVQGIEPVREWLKALPRTDRKVIGADIKTLEYGWPIGMPLCRSISSRKGLWEIRSSLPGKRIARILFCVHDGSLVLLDGFIKKTQKTPAGEIDLAGSRMKQIKGTAEKTKKKKGNSQ